MLITKYCLQCGEPLADQTPSATPFCSVDCQQLLYPVGPTEPTKSVAQPVVETVPETEAQTGSGFSVPKWVIIGGLSLGGLAVLNRWAKPTSRPAPTPPPKRGRGLDGIKPYASPQSTPPPPPKRGTSLDDIEYWAPPQSHKGLAGATPPPKPGTGLDAIVTFDDLNQWAPKRAKTGLKPVPTGFESNL